MSEENKYERYNRAVHEITNTVLSMINFNMDWVLTEDEVRILIVDKIYKQVCEDWALPRPDMSRPWTEIVEAEMAWDVVVDIKDCI
jgi:hypothetical protein